MSFQEYEWGLAQYLGAGVAACYRGYRIYDTDRTKRLVTKYVQFYKASLWIKIKVERAHFLFLFRCCLGCLLWGPGGWSGRGRNRKWALSTCILDQNLDYDAQSTWINALMSELSLLDYCNFSVITQISYANYFNKYYMVMQKQEPQNILWETKTPWKITQFDFKSWVNIAFVDSLNLLLT